MSLGFAPTATVLEPNPAETVNTPTEDFKFELVELNGKQVMAISGLSNPNDVESFRIPDKKDGVPVRVIGEEAFGSWQGKNVYIPDSVTSIGNGAFLGCNSLEKITIPDSITNTGDNAFAYCGSLKNIIIPNGVVNIGNHAFLAMPITAITIPDSVVSIGEGAFEQCSSLTFVKLSNSITTIYTDTFADCTSLTTISIPDGVTTIGGDCTDDWSVVDSGAFANCRALTTVIIPDSVTKIEPRSFYWCKALDDATCKRILEIAPYALEY